jgi:adenine-specific DNA-methyltransferase
MLENKQHIERLFKNSEKFSDKDGLLFLSKILEAIEKIDIELIKILKNDERAKKHFFTQIDDVYILDQNKLIEFFSLNDYMKNGSYTAYSNKIGLIRKDNFIKKFDDVVLAFPHKDCVLEGRQTKEDVKKDDAKETFYNEILLSDEIDRLFEPKVLTNIKRYSKNGVEENCEIKNDDNLIIKGNNLIALHSLKKKFARKVKLIYIDPPYNTGSDSFKYNDNFNHSTWLTFMKNRLEVAREFLSENGILYASFDDKEFHYIKVLLDEIFGRENFVGNIAWESKTKSQNTKDSFNKLQPKVEHILVYTKKDCRRFNLIKKGEQNYPFNDEQGEYREYILETMNSEDTRGRSSMIFEIENVFPPEGKQWKLGQDTILEYKNRNDLFVRDGKIILKKRPFDEKSDLTEPFWGLLQKDIGTAESAKKELTEILQPYKHGFETVKPVELIKRLIFHATNNNDIVMDFFGGSGTTAHAVLDINKEQDKNLQFILIEQMDYIENITKARVKKVIEKNEQGSFVYAELKQIDTFKDVEIGALNKNMQYLPISEIEDESYNIGKEEIAINKIFYGIENE